MLALANATPLMVKQVCRSTGAPVKKFINTQKAIEKERGAGSISNDTVAGGVVFACNSSYPDFKMKIYGTGDEV